MCRYLVSGAEVVEREVQLSNAGEYIFPVFNGILAYSLPPHITISEPVHMEVCPVLGVGPEPEKTGVQLLPSGLYLPPSLEYPVPVNPPHMIISEPVQTAL